MRGIPGNPVTCTGCGELKGSPKDRRCHGCRVKARPNPNHRFFWTQDLDQALARAYKDAHCRRELKENLDHVQQLCGFTRVVMLARAAALGLNAHRRCWTAEEIEILGESAGVLSKAAIARKLRRSYWSVKAELSKLHLSSQVREGYSQTDVAYLLGVGPRSVRKWVARGWLRTERGRITEASMLKLIREHPEEYRLNRVDEAWFKGLLFPAFGRMYIEAASQAAARVSPVNGLSVRFDEAAICGQSPF
jgi:hypothetical protein